MSRHPAGAAARSWRPALRHVVLREVVAGRHPARLVLLVRLAQDDGAERHEPLRQVELGQKARVLRQRARRAVDVAAADALVHGRERHVLDHGGHVRARDVALRIARDHDQHGRAAEVKGISERKAREIAIQVEEKKDMREAMIYLQKYGISTTLAARIYQHYGQSVYRVIEENPYQMADHVPGVGFKTADEIASKVGIHTDSDYRIRSGIFYTLIQSVSEGHVYLLQEVLLYRVSQLLLVDPVTIATLSFKRFISLPPN